MKKIVLFVLLSLSTLTLQAYEGFQCVPSLRETRLQILVQGEDINLTVTNAMGYDFMPQFDGPSSIFNISWHKMQGEDLKDLGDSFTFSWPKSSCQLDTENFKINCRSEAKALVKSVKSYGLTTTEVTERYEDDTYEKRRFRLSLEKVNMYFVSLEFNKQNCEKFN